MFLTRAGIFKLSWLKNSLSHGTRRTMRKAVWQVYNDPHARRLFRIRHICVRKVCFEMILRTFRSTNSCETKIELLFDNSKVIETQMRCTDVSSEFVKILALVPVAGC